MQVFSLSQTRCDGKLHRVVAGLHREGYLLHPPMALTVTLHNAGSGTRGRPRDTHKNTLNTAALGSSMHNYMQHALIAEKVYSVTHTSRILFLCLSIHSVGNTSHTNFRIMKQFYTLYRILKQYSQRGGIRIVNFRDIPKYSQIRFPCNISQLAD